MIICGERIAVVTRQPVACANPQTPHTVKSHGFDLLVRQPVGALDVSEMVIGVCAPSG